jgi:GT2 family glycosyltransferase/SAM-dependent methyltransferase
VTLQREQREGTSYLDPLALLPPQAERVLHVDCGAGALGEELKRRRTCEVVGTEADERLAKEAETRLDRVVALPFASLDGEALGAFDAVVCGDLLCRTAAPEATLARLRALLKPSGTLLASLPNLRHMDIVQSLGEGAWAYGPDSLLGGGYRRGFTRRTAEVLLEDHGFVVTRVIGVPARGHAEWEQVGRPGQLQAGRLGLSGLDPEEAEEFFISEWLVAAEAVPQADWGLTSIVVLTWNQLTYTQLCLESVRKHTHLPYELIVVDNGSTDGTVEWLGEQPDLRLIRNAENLGFPKAANQGLAAARGENVLLLNNDTVVSPGWLRRLLTHLHARPEVGLVGPRSNFVSGAQQVQVPYRNLVEMESFAWRLGRAERGRYDATDRLVGFCLLAKRQVLDRIGLLDERFDLGCFEDDDLCLRARKAGFELRICRDAFVHHYGGRTFVGNQLPSGKILAENQRRFAEKWGLSGPPPVPRAAGEQAAWGLSRHPEGGLLLTPQPSCDGPTISLCMIVRDEADRIRACLESARPYVDEIVVVDTGSRDDTMCIARECGAQVIEHAWEDSFSAARNVSLERATGEWILWLDADDVLPPESGRALRECVRGAPERVLGFVVQVHCPGGPGGKGRPSSIT